MKNRHVTDHAVLRYLERGYGVDIEAIREEIAGHVARGVEHGAVGVRVAGVRFVLRDGFVVTVLDRQSSGLKLDPEAAR